MASALLIRRVLLLSAVMLCSCRDELVSPVIQRTASNVEGFDLVFDDSAAKTEFGLFELGYAIKANYSYVTYRGKLYRSVGGGSVLIRPITDSPAKFVVRETLRSKNEQGSTSSSLLQILDKASGVELAHRGLVANAMEDDTGWTGDHAVKFVRKVLNSQEAPGRPWGANDYEQAAAKVELVKSIESSHHLAQLTPTARNCPDVLRIDRGPNRRAVVRGPGFEFLPLMPLQLIACDSGLVLVASGVYASVLNLDLLTYDGENIAQGYVRLPLPLEAKWFDVAEVHLATEAVEVVLLVNSRSDWRSPYSSYATLHVNATLRCQKTDCNSESKR